MKNNFLESIRIKPFILNCLQLKQKLYEVKKHFMMEIFQERIWKLKNKTYFCTPSNAIFEANT